ncbi:MAG: heme exporter protein CcmB [Legionella sp.]|nr:MAG: heme exporter protein CcmB [Legionella sp.]
MMSLSKLMYQQIQREWRVQMRQKKSWANSLVFFSMIMIFFPLTLPSDPQLQRIIAPGVVWVAVLLSSLLSAERLFQSDYDEGVIELWLVSGQPVSALVLAKVTLHWVLTLIPLIGVSPIIALLFGLDGYAIFVLVMSLICGTPAIMFLSALAAAFGTALRQKGVIMGLILLPLTIPIMILGSATTTAAVSGLPVSGYLAWSLVLSCCAVAALPFAIAGVIRANMG